jgi:hypothetical protein
VKGDGDDHRDRPDRDQINCVSAHDFDPWPLPKTLEFSQKPIKRRNACRQQARSQRVA